MVFEPSTKWECDCPVQWEQETIATETGAVSRLIQASAFRICCFTYLRPLSFQSPKRKTHNKYIITAECLALSPDHKYDHNNTVIMIVRMYVVVIIATNMYADFQKNRVDFQKPRADPARIQKKVHIQQLYHILSTLTRVNWVVFECKFDNCNLQLSNRTTSK